MGVKNFINLGDYFLKADDVKLQQRVAVAFSSDVYDIVKNNAFGTQGAWLNPGAMGRVQLRQPSPGTGMQPRSWQVPPPTPGRRCLLLQRLHRAALCSHRDAGGR